MDKEQDEIERMDYDESDADSKHYAFGCVIIYIAFLLLGTVFYFINKYGDWLWNL